MRIILYVTFLKGCEGIIKKNKLGRPKKPLKL